MSECRIIRKDLSKPEEGEIVCSDRILATTTCFNIDVFPSKNMVRDVSISVVTSDVEIKFCLRAEAFHAFKHTEDDGSICWNLYTKFSIQ